MKRGEVITVALAVAIAAVVVKTGAAHLPATPPTPFRHPPVIVYSEPMLHPLVVTAERVIPRSVRDRHLFPRLPNVRKAFERAVAGREVKVSLTQYCLQGTTRRDHWVREGIVAADPRVFPLARYVEVFLGKRYLGRFLVDDTGGKVKGATLDIWTPSCAEARKFGRREGTATMVVKPEN